MYGNAFGTYAKVYASVEPNLVDIDAMLGTLFGRVEVQVGFSPLFPDVLLLPLMSLFVLFLNSRPVSSLDAFACYYALPHNYSSLPLPLTFSPTGSGQWQPGLGTRV